MIRKVLTIAGLLPGVMAFFGQPQQAQAITIQAVECSVAVFPCPLAFRLGFGAAGDGLNLVNGVDINAFNFANADLTFVGTITATNFGGFGFSINGTGVATTLAGIPAAATYLDVDITETYTANPLIWGAIGVGTEYNIGNCNAAATAAGSSVQAQLVMDGTLLPILGAAGDSCTANLPVGGLTPFAYANGGFVGINPIVAFDALAQFEFLGGVAGQAIDLPYGEQDTTPEPGSWALMTGAFAGLGLLTKRLRKAR